MAVINLKTHFHKTVSSLWCNLGNEQRALTGLWPIPAFTLALEKGYKVAKITEVWHFNKDQIPRLLQMPRFEGWLMCIPCGPPHPSIHFGSSSYSWCTTLFLSTLHKKWTEKWVSWRVMKPHLQFLVQIFIDVTVKLPRIVREYNKGAHTKSWLSSSLQTLFYMFMHVCPCFSHLLHQLPIVLAKCKKTADEGIKTSVQLFNRTVK